MISTSKCSAAIVDGAVGMAVAVGMAGSLDSAIAGWRVYITRANADKLSAIPGGAGILPALLNRCTR
jgi:hypothetical protein